VCVRRPTRSPWESRGACRSGSVRCSLRWSNQDHFARRRGCAESAAHPMLAVELAVLIDVSAGAQVAIESSVAVSR